MTGYDYISSNIEALRRRVEAAAEKSGRKASDIDIIAVSKTKPIEMIIAATKSGLYRFGENRAQELLEKQRAAEAYGIDTAARVIVAEPRGCSSGSTGEAADIDNGNAAGIEWHFIGSLQTNKVRQIVGRTKLIHSLDRFELADEIQRCASKRGIVVDTLVQVNIAKEDSKSGFFHENIEEILIKLSEMRNIRINGLMTIAPFVDDPEENRTFFRALNKIFVDMSMKKMDNVNMAVLSAGMSNDFEVAIEEGANMVRIGTSVFGERI